MSTILLIDDDEGMLNLISQNLSHEHYQVIAANSPKKGLDLASNCEPDLIVLDVVMPEMTGIEVFDALRKKETTYQTPVIFLTSVATSMIYPTVADGSRVAHLKKPVDLPELISLAKELIERYPRLAD